MNFNSSIDGIEKQVINDNQQNFRRFLKNEIQNKYDISLTNAITIAQNRYVINGLLQDDRESVLKNLSKLAKIYKNETNYKNVKIHVHRPDIRSFVRHLKPNKFNDDLSSFRNTILKVKDTKTTCWSRSWCCKISFKRAVPCFDNGNYIGSVEFIQDFGSIIKQAKAKFNASIVF